MNRYSSNNVLNIRRSGFSLVELVVVIAITGVIAATVGIFLLRPIQGYNAQVRRAELVDEAEGALRRMQRDIRASLPNSIRIRTPAGNVGDAACPANNSVCVIEMLHGVDGGRYRASPPGDQLLFNGVDTAFDVVGSLLNSGSINTTNNWIVLSNQTTTGATFNAYNCPAAGSSHNCVRLNNTTTLGSTPPHIVMAAAFSPISPALASPRQRFYIVDTPVTYLCNTTNGTLDRYQGYTITANHASVDTDAELMALAGVSRARAADQVTTCHFTYQSGASSTAGLVTLDITITDPNVNGTSEQVRLLHQVHVYNTP